MVINTEKIDEILQLLRINFIIDGIKKIELTVSETSFNNMIAESFGKDCDIHFDEFNYVSKYWEGVVIIKHEKKCTQKKRTTRQCDTLIAICPEEKKRCCPATS